MRDSTDDDLARLEKLRERVAEHRRRLGNLRASELCELAVAADWTLRKSGGGHRVYARDDAYPLVVPWHGGGKAVKSRTALTVLRHIDDNLAARAGDILKRSPERV